MNTGWRRPVPMADYKEECKREYMKLKEDKKYRSVILKIIGKNLEVVKTIKQNGKSNEESLKDLKSCLPKSYCRYVIYDFHESNAQPEQRRILFITWSPDDAWMAKRYKDKAKEYSKLFDDFHNNNNIIAKSYEDLDYTKLKEANVPITG